MAVFARHSFVSTKPDGSDPDKVNASNWNADHDITLTGPALAGKNDAGAGNAVEISVGNGVEFNGAAIRRSELTGDVTAAAGSNSTTIANSAVTFAKIQNVATDTLIGRDAASTGVTTSISVTGGVEFSGSNSIRTTAFTGDVTKSAGGTSLTIANSAVTNAKMANMAQSTIKGRQAGGGTGAPEDLTAAQARAALELGSFATEANPITTKGDLLARSASALARLAVGSNGHVLTADSAEATGLKWAAIAGGKVAQVVETTWTTETNHTSNWQFNDNALANSVGAERFTLAITPTNASSTLLVFAIVPVHFNLAGVNTETEIDARSGAGLFRDSGTGLAANNLRWSTNNPSTNSKTYRFEGQHHLMAAVAASSTSATTFRIRTGRAVASGSGTLTVTHNGPETNNGTLCSRMIIIEVLP